MLNFFMTISLKNKIILSLKLEVKYILSLINKTGIFKGTVNFKSNKKICLEKDKKLIFSPLKKNYLLHYFCPKTLLDFPLYSQNLNLDH